MRLSEFVQLLEAVSVDDFLQFAVVVVVDASYSAAKLHQFTILLCVGMPCAGPIDVGVASMISLIVAFIVSIVFLSYFSLSLCHFSLNSMLGFITS